MTQIKEPKYKQMIEENPTLDAKGREILDPTPLALPVGFKHPPTLSEQMEQMFRSYEVNRAIANQGHETFDEANDFDVEDDPDELSSPYSIVTGKHLLHLF